MLNRLAGQFLLDSLIAPTPARSGKLRRLASVSRRAFLRVSDPLVTYEMLGARLTLPLSHELPVYRSVYPQYAQNLMTIASYVHDKYEDLTAIDIGANVGDSVVMLRAAGTFPILCIEGDDKFFQLLMQNVAQFNAIETEHIFVGAPSMAQGLAVRRSRGTARLENVGAADGVAMAGLEDILDRHERFRAAKLVKLDTDGFDCIILVNTAQVLSAVHPVVFFEYDPHFYEHGAFDCFSVFASLTACGYQRAIFWDNTGDYLMCIDLDDIALLTDVHTFYSGQNGARYCDIAVFSGEDLDICDGIRLTELTRWRERRAGHLLNATGRTNEKEQQLVSSSSHRD
jgi:FkbM family methyltransferase